MKKMLLSAFAFAYILTLAGCAHEADLAGETPGNSQEAAPISENEPETKEPGLPENLPATLAAPEDLDGSGGYLLLGEIPEADLALYCDNLEDRNTVYIRCGEHFQAFEQKAWSDPTILPELDWQDWDGDGTMELAVKYLRHEGTFFDGETVSPGLVYELVVYKWDETQWADIRFSSGGPPRTLEVESNTRR